MSASRRTAFEATICTTSAVSSMPRADAGSRPCAQRRKRGSNRISSASRASPSPARTRSRRLTVSSGDGGGSDGRPSGWIVTSLSTVFRGKKDNSAVRPGSPPFYKKRHIAPDGTGTNAHVMRTCGIRSGAVAPDESGGSPPLVHRAPARHPRPRPSGVEHHMAKTARAAATVQTTPSLLDRGQADTSFPAVQAFLQHFGYLKRETFDAGTLDDRTSEALAVYQERHALPVTGVFDEATRAQMSKHRCGMPDLDNGVAFATRCAWPTPQITFAFEDGTPDADR